MRQVTASYPLTPLQHGMLFHHLLEPDGGLYLVQQVCTLPHPVDAPALRRAWEAVTARHDVLRTSLRWENLESPVQDVHSDAAIRWAEKDWRGSEGATQEQRLRAFLDAERRANFDLREAPLHQLTLLRLADDRYQLVWTWHHTIIDGRSSTIVLRDVFARYDSAGAPLEEPASPPPFRVFVEWLREQPIAQAEGFWRERLSGFGAPTPVPGLRPEPAGEAVGLRAGQLVTPLSATTTAALKQSALDHNLTLNTIIQGAWAVLLWQHSAETDVVFGVTRAGRHDVPGGNKLVGPSINTLPLRIRIDPHRGIADWLADVRRCWSELREVEQTPLGRVQQWSELPAGTPLFDSLVIFERARQHDILRAGGPAWVSRTIVPYGQGNYAWALAAWGGEVLTLQIRYDRARVDDTAAAGVLSHVRTLIERIAERPDLRLEELPFPAGEPSGTRIDAAIDEGPAATLVDLFEQQVARVPDRAAVVSAPTSILPAGGVSDAVTLTYRDLQARAQRVAEDLNRRGLAPGECVGLLLDRSVEAIVGLVGILEAGGAYMPLSIDAPPARIAQQLEESGARYVVTTAALAPLVTGPPDGVTIVLLDGAAARGPRSRRKSAAPARPLPGSPAYVLFTGGSTGVPKGVAVTHANAVHYARAVSRELADVPRTTPGDGLAALDGLQLGMVTTLGADSGNTSLITALIAGATVHVLARDVATEPRRFVEYLTAHPLDLLKIMSNHLQALVTGRSGAALAEVLPRRWLVLGGESLSLAFARTVLETGRCRLLNHYGPTETTVGVLTCEVTAESLGSWEGFGAATVPVGRPLANTSAYIVDERDEEQPAGVPGELLVGGAGVAMGYLNRPELTAERFVAHRGERVYRTGDRVRRLPDGTVEFQGRLDDQVKVRGYRVEPAEIEHVMRTHPGVTQAAVVARRSAAGDTELIGFVAIRSPAPTDGELGEWLSARLPAHMVPARIVRLDALPLTGGGKIDRPRLAGTLAPAAEPEGAFQAPRTETESKLAAIWAEVLKRDRIGVTDTFQALGGHSLVAIRILGRITRDFSIRLPLRALFDTPTIARLAEVVDGAVTGASSPAGLPGGIPRTDPSGAAPLSIGQELLWLVERATSGQAAYNVPHSIRIKGPFDEAAFQRALDALAKRHDVLGSRYPAVGGLPVQIRDPELRPEVDTADFRRRPAATRLEEARAWVLAAARRPFDLTEALPIRAAIARIGKDERWVVLLLHHLVSDAWSRDVLFQEVSELYEAGASGRAPALAPLPVQYRDFARWQRVQLEGAALARLLEFWRGQLPEAAEPIALPYDRAPAAAPSFAGERVTLALGPSAVEGVRALGASCGASLFVTMLAAFQTLLHRYGGQGSVTVAAPVAGRERPEVHPLIGYFSNTLFFRAGFADDPSFRTVLARGRDTAYAAFAHQDLPYERLVLDLDGDGRRGAARSFQAMFSMESERNLTLRLGAAEVAPLDLAGFGVAKADIVLVALETDDGLRLTIDYRVDRFERDTAARMLAHLDTLLRDAVARPDTPVSRLALLPTDERATLARWSGAVCPTATGPATLHAMVAAQVDRTPEAPAVSDGTTSVTYAELARRGAAAASHLRRAGVGPGSRVAVLADRSIDLVAGLLGVLEAGAAYVPIDPGYPAGRIRRMLDDAGVAAVLVDRAGAARVPATPVPRIQLGDAVAAAIDPADPAAAADAPAYVIYTSGSTGAPKGVVIGHGAVVNHMRWMQDAFPTGPGDTVLQRTPIAFDASVWEFWAPLVSGARLFIATPSGGRDPAYLAELLGSGAVTTVQLVPTLLEALLEQPGFAPSPRLARVFCGGEPLTTTLVTRFRAVCDALLVNLYGPTEATIDATSWTHRAGEPVPDIVPIGKPITNTCAWVLDRRGELVPCGVAGELFLGGLGLAIGYWGRPDLTAERFAPDPLRPGQRMYRTGDRVRWLADGNLQYIGRADDQVKLRGFRVEPGEIEATMASLEGVRGAAVVVREARSGLQRLLGYFVADPASGLSPAEVRAALRDRLPEFMVPAAVTRLAELPLAPNGKVDRAALPEPQECGPAERLAPSTETEARIAEVWREVLGRGALGVTENFFEIGGHSLHGLRILARITALWGVRLTLEAIFDAPTIAALSLRVDQARASEDQRDAPIRQVKRARRRR